VSYLPRTGRRRPVARSRWLLVLALVIAALVAFCGHTGKQRAKRQAVPSASSRGHAPTWAFQYVHFVTPSDGWATADNDQSGFTDLLTSDDGGRRWHDVTPQVVVASDNAWLYDSSHNRDFENTSGGRIEEAATVQALRPFALNARDAWLPVLRSYGQRDQSSEVDLFMTSDAGRRWALRGRFPGAEVLGIFFLSPSNGFIETDEGAASDEDPVQIYATSDRGKHWREVSASPPFNGPGGSPKAIGDYCDKDGVSYANASVGFATVYCDAGAAYLNRTSDGGGKWDGIFISRYEGDDGSVTYPPVFSSSEVGSMVVQVVPVVLVATTTDAGRHWGLRQLPPPAERLLLAGDTCLPGCVDLVSARTWLVGAGHELYITTDAGRSWRASPSPMALTNRQPGGYQQPDFLNSLQLDFLGPRVGWAYWGDWWDATDHLWRTTDGGRHWSTYSLGPSV
jgi:photosystem II stability/assembly factor-like uncharacterized protein